MPTRTAAKGAAQDGIMTTSACPTFDLTVERIKSYLNPNDQALELGGGDGRMAEALAGDVAHYTFSDAEDDLVSVARARTRHLSNVTCVSLSTQDAALPRGQDVVIAIDLLHQLDDLPRALQRMRGLLRPGGHLIARTPTVAGPGQALALPDVVRRFFGMQPRMNISSPQGLERMVRLAEFDIVSCDMVPRGSTNCMIVAKAR